VACAPGDPYGVDGEAILATLFPRGHPYSWPVIGSMDDLNKATLDHLKVFFTEYYHPANVITPHLLDLAGRRRLSYRSIALIALSTHGYPREPTGSSW